MSNDWPQIKARLEEYVEMIRATHWVPFGDAQRAADIRAALQRVEELEEKRAQISPKTNALDVEHTTSCGHTWTIRHTACPECFAALRQRVEELEREARLNRQAAEKHYAYGEAQKERAEAAEAKLDRVTKASEMLAREVDDMGLWGSLSDDQLERFSKYLDLLLAAAKGEK